MLILVCSTTDLTVNLEEKNPSKLKKNVLRFQRCWKAITVLIRAYFTVRELG